MRKLIIGALGLSLLASSAAFAQEAASPQPPPPPAGAGAPPPPPRENALGARAGDEAGPRGDEHRRPPEGGPKGEARMGPKGPDGPPPSKAAEFRFKRGPLEVTVRCSELEPIKPCADAANQLMDKFATLSPDRQDAAPAPAPRP